MSTEQMDSMCVCSSCSVKLGDCLAVCGAPACQGAMLRGRGPSLRVCLCHLCVSLVVANCCTLCVLYCCLIAALRLQAGICVCEDGIADCLCLTVGRWFFNWACKDVLMEACGKLAELLAVMECVLRLL
jgi:hypothetical protein